MTKDRQYLDKLYQRATDILDGRAIGHAFPILWKLKNRNYGDAISYLSDFVDVKTSISILRKKAIAGDTLAQKNLAVEYRNSGDLKNYRYWLARAAKSDESSAIELKKFQTRFPYEIMRRYKMLSTDRSHL